MPEYPADHPIYVIDSELRRILVAHNRRSIMSMVIGLLIGGASTALILHVILSMVH